MDIELSKFDEIKDGWDIAFTVNLTQDELNKCNLKSAKYIGDYDIVLKNRSLLFNCVFDHGELKEKETINERLELIKLDIENITKSCFN